jgi:hypothetical protein
MADPKEIPGASGPDLNIVQNPKPPIPFKKPDDWFTPLDQQQQSADQPAATVEQSSASLPEAPTVAPTPVDHMQNATDVRNVVSESAVKKVEMKERKPGVTTRRERHERAYEYLKTHNPAAAALYSGVMTDVDKMRNDSSYSRTKQRNEFKEFIKSQPEEVNRSIASVDSVYRQHYYNALKNVIDGRVLDPYDAVQQKLFEFKRLQEDAANAGTEENGGTKSSISESWLKRSIRGEERKLYSAYVKQELKAGHSQHLDELAGENRRLAGILKDMRRKEEKRQEGIRQHTADMQVQQLSDYDQAQQARQDYTASLSTAEGPKLPEPEEKYDPRKETFEKNFANLQSSTLESDAKNAVLNGNTDHVASVGVITGGGRNRMHTAVSSSASVLNAEQKKPEDKPEEPRVPHRLGDSVRVAQARNEQETGGISAAHKVIEEPIEVSNEVTPTVENKERVEKILDMVPDRLEQAQKDKKDPHIWRQRTRVAVMVGLGLLPGIKLLNGAQTPHFESSDRPIVQDVGKQEQPGAGLFTITDNDQPVVLAGETTHAAPVAEPVNPGVIEQPAVVVEPTATDKPAEKVSDSDTETREVSPITDALMPADTLRGGPDVGAPVEDREEPKVDVAALNPSSESVESPATPAQETSTAVVSDKETSAVEENNGWKPQMIEEGGTLGEYLSQNKETADFWNTPDIIAAQYLRDFDTIVKERTKDGEPAMSKEEILAWNIKAKEELKSLDERVAKGELTKDSEEYKQKVDEIMEPGREAIRLIPAGKPEDIVQSKAAAAQTVQQEKEVETKAAQTQATQTASTGKSLFSRLFGRRGNK